MNDIASNIPTKWPSVGIQLGLPQDILDNIQQENAEELHVVTVLHKSQICQIMSLHTQISGAQDQILFFENYQVRSVV